MVQTDFNSNASHAEDFRLAMQDFRSVSKQPDRPPGTGSKLETALSWNDVLLVVKRAVDDYNSKGQNGASGFFRRFGRGFSEHAPTVRAVLNLVPKSDYTEPLLGVFDFIIDVINSSIIGSSINISTGSSPTTRKKSTN